MHVQICISIYIIFFIFFTENYVIKSPESAITLSVFSFISFDMWRTSPSVVKLVIRKNRKTPRRDPIWSAHVTKVIWRIVCFYEKEQDVIERYLQSSYVVEWLKFSRKNGLPSMTPFKLSFEDEGLGIPTHFDIFEWRNEEIFFSSIVEWISKFFKRNLWIKVRYALVCT